MLSQRVFSKAFGSLPLAQGVRVPCRNFASAPIQAKVVRYHQFGQPANVLKIEQETISGDLKSNEVLVRMEAAPINPADINIIEGAYGTRSQLPAIPGLEGVGTILAVGSDVKSFQVNDRVIPTQPEFGTWRTHAVAPEDQLMKVSKDIPLSYAATLSVNPATAFRLLKDFAKLEKGDTIIQNGSNSMVGQAVIQIAKVWGINTINVVRERVGHEDVVSQLKALGGTVVVTDKYLRTPDFKYTVSTLSKPKVAFNCVGGDVATEIARNLEDGGTLVTYGAMGRQPVALPNSLLIFRNISHRGFWLTKWVKEHSKEERAAMLKELEQLVSAKQLLLYTEAYRLSDFEEGIRRNALPFRERKFVWELQK